jgi:hypothetical protein
MASTFHVFRRNQKLLLAILTLMAMFAFVFLDPLLKLLGDNRPNADPVVAETKYGELRRSTIQQLTAKRQLVETFLKHLAYRTVNKMMDQGRADLRTDWIKNLRIGQTQQQFLRQVMRSDNPAEKRQVVGTMLLDHEAQSRGIVISDEAINRLLQQITQGNVTGPEMARIIRDLKDVTDRQLFDALRTELAATSVVHSFGISVEALPPAEMWGYYKRLNQKATIEALPVSVSNYVDRVADPSEEELKAFFEKYKDQFAYPGSPEPGFKLPRRMRFQYFKAELDLFRQLAKVSDEEIKKYYEDNKESFRKLELPKDSPTGDDVKKSEDPEPAPTDKTDTPTTSESEAKPVTADEPSAPASEKSEPKPEPPATNAATPTKTPVAPKATPKATPKTAPAPKTNQGSAIERTQRRDGVKFLLVADEKLAQADPEAEAPKAEEKAAEPDAVPVESKAEVKSEADAQKPDAEKPADQKPEDKKPEEPQYSPLEEVKDKIIQAIKDDKARTEIREGLDELASRLSDYSDLLSTYNVQDSNAKPPKEPNFAELAKQHSFSFEETNLVSENDLRQDKGFGSSRAGEYMIGQVAFGGGSSLLYMPTVSQDTDGNAYLSWKAEDVADAIPKFEDVREEVLKTWKKVKARDEARKQAERYAAEAKGKKLSEAFTGEKDPKVIKAGPFTWMTMGMTADNAQRGMPMLSDVPGIESPSMEFMRTVFDLEPGGVGVAVNGPEDIFYVVQVVEYSPPIEELDAEFARTDPRQYAGIAVMEKQGLLQEWFATIESRAGLKWLIEPSEEGE